MTDLDCGNRETDSDGFLFEPAIIKHATAEMLMTREESFAPICTLYSFETEEEAVEAANKTSVCSSPFSTPLNSTICLRQR